MKRDSSPKTATEITKGIECLQQKRQGQTLFFRFQLKGYLRASLVLESFLLNFKTITVHSEHDVFTIT